MERGLVGFFFWLISKGDHARYDEGLLGSTDGG